mmetsp:Transcript_25466/g.46290  ORF Transcript_25466/g.46290 Transcript_25466/m.46290 type:complete len:106 (-) Transcript_25466:1191-1508(-)
MERRGSIEHLPCPERPWIAFPGPSRGAAAEWAMLPDRRDPNCRSKSRLWRSSEGERGGGERGGGLGRERDGGVRKEVEVYEGVDVEEFQVYDGTWCVVYFISSVI